MLSNVDFPQPDGPTRMKNSPSSIVKSASFTAYVPVRVPLRDLVDDDGNHVSLLSSVRRLIGVSATLSPTVGQPPVAVETNANMSTAGSCKDLSKSS